jgi:plastocyanin
MDTNNNTTSNNMMRIILIIVVLAVIVGAVVLLMNNKNNNAATNTTPGTTSNTTTTPENTNNQQSQSATPTEQTSTTTITYSNNSFSPAEVTVKSGGSVKVVNQSDQAIYFASDPHPVHTANPELNLGEVAAGQSKTFTVTKSGTWGYHNHYKPEVTGKIVVQ